MYSSHNVDIHPMLLLFVFVLVLKYIINNYRLNLVQGTDYVPNQFTPKHSLLINVVNSDIISYLIY